MSGEGGRGQRQGPCANLECTDPDNASGQWTFLPEDFAAAHPEVTRTCVCKKRPCWRWCGKLPPLAVPGRAAKRAAVDGGGAPVGVPLDALSRPPITVSIDEIWGERCAALCPHLPARLRFRTDCASRAYVLDRCVDISLMDGTDRGNKLEAPRSASLEFAVHGKWRRHEGDANGIHGCWYTGVPELVRAFGASHVRERVAEYAAVQAAAAEEAIAAAVAAIEAEVEEGGGTEDAS